MRVGLIDVDGHGWPNIPLMKLSAWHKSKGDTVEWYVPLFGGHYDKLYMSKVFSFTEDYPWFIEADEIVRGGTGYCIETINGKECFDKSKNHNLPYEIEHIYPDYSLYPEETKDTAYGFLSRGCPRGCGFCHVEAKEGRRAYRVANLTEFWNGQKNIVLCDPNLIACKEWKDLLQQLIDSKAEIEINQGIDIRMMTAEKAAMLKQIRIKMVHFAWDRYQDKHLVVPNLKTFKSITGWDRRKLIVYTLMNFDTSISQDLERVYTCREIGVWPYVMLYNKNEFVKVDSIGRPYALKDTSVLLNNGYTTDQIEHFDLCWKMQRWVNNRAFWERVPDFKGYLKTLSNGEKYLEMLDRVIEREEEATDGLQTGKGHV